VPLWPIRLGGGFAGGKGIRKGIRTEIWARKSSPGGISRLDASTDRRNKRISSFPAIGQLWHSRNMNDATSTRGIFGIGYEGLDLDEFVHRLMSGGAGILADVRLNAISRKRGFSKRLLGAALADAGISYWHVPELGNPGWNRAGFSGSSDEVHEARARFTGMIGGETADTRLEEIAAAARVGVVAVMCVEADERNCHRYVVLQELHRRLDLCAALS